MADVKTNTQHGASDDAPKESPQDVLARLSNGEIANDPHEGFIVHKSYGMDENGNRVERVHGPMPVSEWRDYARKMGF